MQNETCRSLRDEVLADASQLAQMLAACIFADNPTCRQVEEDANDAANYAAGIAGSCYTDYPGSPCNAVWETYHSAGVSVSDCIDGVSYDNGTLCAELRAAALEAFVLAAGAVNECLDGSAGACDAAKSAAFGLLDTANATAEACASGLNSDNGSACALARAQLDATVAAAAAGAADGVSLAIDTAADANSTAQAAVTDEASGNTHSEQQSVASASIEVPGTGVAAKGCNWAMDAAFRGVRDNKTKVISGSWLHSASVGCDFPAKTLFVSTYLWQEGNTVSYDSNDQSPSKYVNASTTYVCGRCNNTWQHWSDSIIQLGVGLIWADWPPGCFTDSTETTLYCTFSTPPQTLR